MRARSLPFRLALPAALVALVAILGTLQYRWLGQVSEAERDRLQKSVRAQAQAFADAVDTELLWIHLAFQAGGSVSPEEPEVFARRFDTWREKAAYPQMVRAVYFADGSKPGYPLQEYRPAERRFVAVAWPPALEAVRASIGNPDPPPAGAAVPHLPVLRDPVVASVPALVVPIPSFSASPTVLTPGRAVAGLGFADRSLVVQLDLGSIRSTMLPALAAQFLPSGDAEPYRLAIADAQDPSRVVFSRGVPSGARLDPRHSDAAVPLLALRFDLAARVTPRLGFMTGHVEAKNNFFMVRKDDAPGQPPDASATPTGTFAIYIQSKEAKGGPPRTTGDVLRINARTSSSGGWRLVLQHPAGSLDAAVARARSRNAWLGFGILAVLAASVGLIVINAQRAERLARQQMDFVATVSHELRTPLAVIRSAAQNLSAGVVQDAERTKHYGEIIDTEGRRLSDMVEQVLEYAGLTGGRPLESPRAVDVDALVRDVLASASPILDESGIEVIVDVPDGLPELVADERAVARALTNVVTNACKHAADGRWIGISAYATRRRGRDEVEITVRDRGQGIPAEDLPHVFEPFYRGHEALRRQVPGNGLGLSLVKRIVEAAGGRVTVASSAGQGTAFTLSLPAAAQEAAAEAPSQADAGRA